VTPSDIRFAHNTLRYGSPQQVGLAPEPIARMVTDAAAYLVPTPDHPTWPTYAGAVVLAAKDGVIVQHAAVGDALRYRAVGPPPERIGEELPPAERIPMRKDTIFDLASVTKLFTTIIVMREVEAGRIDLDAPVAQYLPEFAAGGKASVTVHMLLTHTSGLPASYPLWSTYPTPETRLAAALAAPLAPGATPGNQYIYADLNLIAAGALVHRLTGQPLDELVRAHITGPLGMRDTGYNPAAALRQRIAATEYQPYAGRGMVWGEVHDENSWGLGGVAGHAGLFSTAADLAVFSQMLLNGGVYGRARILRADTMRTMLVNYNAALEPLYSESDRGLGLELNKHWYMGPLASPVTFGHTGFTGTSIAIDPLSRSFVILLSNRVHPDRNWGGNNPARRAVARAFGEAIAVRPPSPAAWRATPPDATTATLTAPLPAPASAGELSFQLWYDTEPRFDTVTVESTVDGAMWTALPLTLRRAGHAWSAGGTVTGYGARGWWHVTAELPEGTTALRWAYKVDGSAQGRGVYVDKILVTDRDGLLFAGDGRDAARLVTVNWIETNR
jgi:CubicO group peptidase (beta-lactamase class C family)